MGPPPCPWTPLERPDLPVPFASKMDSPLPLLRLPCHHPSHPPALPPARELPSLGLAGGGSGGVRQSPRLPAGEPPQAPQVAGRPPAPQARALFVWLGGGEPRLAPGAAGLCQSLPGLRALPSPRTLHALSAMLRDGCAHARSGFLLGLRQPAAVSAGRCGNEWDSGPFRQLSPGPQTPPSEHRVRDWRWYTQSGSPTTSPRPWESQAPSCCLTPIPQAPKPPTHSSSSAQSPRDLTPAPWRSSI